ncbi:MAG: hypothetical protein SGARI_004209 [Bacillariaceae sp.]
MASSSQTETPSPVQRTSAMEAAPSPLQAEVHASLHRENGNNIEAAVGPPPMTDDKEEQKPWFKTRTGLYVVLGLVIALASGIGVGVALASRSKGATDPMKTQAVQEHIVDAGITDSDILQDEGSPQSKAYDWLITSDELTEFSDAMNTDQVETMNTRYVLAVLFHALDGDDWHSSAGWLDGSLHHCEWEYISCEDEDQETDAAFNPVTMIRTKIVVESARAGGGNENMRGALPAEISFLSKLGEIDDNR